MWLVDDPVDDVRNMSWAGLMASIDRRENNSASILYYECIILRCRGDCNDDCDHDRGHQKPKQKHGQSDKNIVL